MQVSLKQIPNMRLYRLHNAYLTAVTFHFLKFLGKNKQNFFVNKGTNNKDGLKKKSPTVCKSADSQALIILCQYQ